MQVSSKYDDWIDGRVREFRHHVHQSFDFGGNDEGFLQVEEIMRKVLRKSKPPMESVKKTKRTQRKPSAYNFYFKDHMHDKDVISLVPKERMKVIGKKWKELSTEDRIPYEEQAKTELPDFPLQFNSSAIEEECEELNDDSGDEDPNEGAE